MILAVCSRLRCWYLYQYACSSVAFTSVIMLLLCTFILQAWACVSPNLLHSTSTFRLLLRCHRPYATSLPRSLAVLLNMVWVRSGIFELLSQRSQIPSEQADTLPSSGLHICYPKPKYIIVGSFVLWGICRASHSIPGNWKATANATPWFRGQV